MLSQETLVAVAEAAGAAILTVYNRPIAPSVDRKADDSPLTEADLRSHASIVDALARLTPDIPVVSEEDDGALATAETFWLVDPLDGTKEFIKRTGEFTVNIALVSNGVPVAGVVHAPVLDATWVTTADGAECRRGAATRPLRVREPAALDALRVVASRDHAGTRVQALLAQLPGVSTLSMGSSLKFCLVAEGQADLYYRDGPTMPWDTAAAHAVLSAAGGEVYALDGSPLRYHVPRSLNPHFVAVGDRSLAWSSLLATGDKP
jgi:3'(2'), 5'-bisphosphate nucleotidase